MATQHDLQKRIPFEVFLTTQYGVTCEEVITEYHEDEAHGFGELLLALASSAHDVPVTDLGKPNKRGNWVRKPRRRTFH